MSPAEVSILAGGWSARAYDVQRLPGHVIGVNEAGILARCDAIVSMDRLWTESRWAQLQALARPAWIRAAALKKIPPHWPHWLRRFECDHTSAVMSDDPAVLNGTNSGLCAVNLAFQLRPRVLRLYGMDLSNGPNGERHWWPDYDFKPAGKGTSDGSFRAWRGHLDEGLRQCREAGIVVEIMRGDA